MACRFGVMLGGDDGEHLEAVAAAVEDEVRRLEAVLSRFDPSAEVRRLNRDAAAGPVRLSVELFDLLVACDRYRERTDGAFDVTAGSPHDVPHPRLLFDPVRRAVRFAADGVRVDHGGIGKGFALDRAAELVRRFGVERALLDAGTSSVLAIGEWPIDVRDPLRPYSPPVDTLTLADNALSCSAIRHPGQPVSDILDAHTGRPLDGAATCAVVAGTATDAEVLSTALLSMGRERAVRYLERDRWPGARVGWIDPPADPSSSPRLDWLTEPP